MDFQEFMNLIDMKLVLRTFALGAFFLAAPAVVSGAEASNLFFEPVHYRPMPARTAALAKNSLLLNGAWLLDAAPGDNAREKSLSDASWKAFTVPGQWVLQGFDIPLDKPAAVAKEFLIPKEWANFRIFLRFDAIHGGTHYWSNGRPLGYSENLFTPVEWEITDNAHPGQMNRLDLQMLVSTASEHLSYSSDYTQHSLGGIDRAVRVYALPKLQISTLRLDAGLDNAYRNGELQVDLAVDNPEKASQSKVEIRLKIYNSDGKEIKHSTPKMVLEPIKPGANAVGIRTEVANPLKWNAEQPNLYRLVIELAKDGKMLERIERNIGFRKIEVKGRQLYVNGAVVKLAGVCHHEIDPLTGRADTMRHAEEDVKLFKSANLNDVRTSHDDGRLITVEGRGFSLVLDRKTGDLDASNAKQCAPLVAFPSLHLTRYDYGDLDAKKPRYAEFPDAKTRVVENVTALETNHGLEMTVKDNYKDFAGTIHWLIDKNGVGEISYDYTYTGNKFDSREAGIKALLRPEYDEVKWRRWSEWGSFPQDSISRPEGHARARRDKSWPDQPANVKPSWPWSQDQTDLGTADFRSIKFNIYDAALVAPDGSGVRVEANADAHFRSCLTKNGVMMHILRRCPLAQVVVNKGARLTGKFMVRLITNH